MLGWPPDQVMTTPIPLILLALKHHGQHERRQFRQHAALFGVKIDDESDVKVDKRAAGRRLMSILGARAKGKGE